MRHLGPQVLLLLVEAQTEPDWTRQTPLCDRQGMELSPSAEFSTFFFLVRSVQPALCEYIPYSRMYLEQIESRPPSVRKEQAKPFIQTFR